MNDEPCIVTLNGSDYYYPCDKRHDLFVNQNGYLVNTSSSQIILYKNISSDGSATYPRIYCPTYTRAYYKSSSTSSNTYLTITSINWKSGRQTFDVYLMIVLIGVMVINLFKR